MKKEMLINVLQPEECRIAILEDGVLEELYVERTSHESYVGNVYKGRIVNIEPSIQAAFVDFGVGRNGFLHVSDVEPAYYRHLVDKQRSEGGGRRPGGRDRFRASAGREEEPEPGEPRQRRRRDEPQPESSPSTSEEAGVAPEREQRHGGRGRRGSGRGRHGPGRGDRAPREASYEAVPEATDELK